MTKIVMGFDVSSTCTAWASLKIENSEISYLDSGYILPPKGEDVIERLAITRDKIKAVLVKVNPTDIAIEDIIQFMKGSSGAKTIIMLTSFNRMVALTVRDHLGTSPVPYNVMAIRHGLKTSSALPAKEEIPELVAHHLKISFPYEYKVNKKTGESKILTPSYDKADAIAVALKHAFELTNVKKPTFKKPKK
jgi:Holliday junction resolvasome RuvABC endonuclease subunit